MLIAQIFTGVKDGGPKFVCKNLFLFLLISAHGRITIMPFGINEKVQSCNTRDQSANGMAIKRNLIATCEPEPLFIYDPFKS